MSDVFLLGKKCFEADCNEPQFNRGYCAAHYEKNADHLPPPPPADDDGAPPPPPEDESVSESGSDGFGEEERDFDATAYLKSYVSVQKRSAVSLSVPQVPSNPNQLNPDLSNSLRRPSSVLRRTSLTPSIFQNVENDKLGQVNELFAREAKQGRITKEVFDKAMTSILNIDDPLLLNQFFKAFNPTILVSDFVARIATLTISGTLENAVNFAFDCYDVDGSGRVTLENFKRLLKATLSTRNKDHLVNELWLSNTVKTIFQANASALHVDETGTPYMTRAEFTQFVASMETQEDGVSGLTI